MITDDCEIKYSFSLVSKQGFKMRLRIKELEEKLLYATQKYLDAEQEVSLWRILFFTTYVERSLVALNFKVFFWNIITLSK